ncbi:capsid protein [Pedobacter sp. AK013]|uniref:phage portal protein n=1 Tax=Pedobacter sp. AK013 TaxID=2723071 RepID=UPI001613A8FC|nr:phage portal protein [Pedobacter sp. AK013]MBB6236501.1 capsid protein [Pedobacter sp. AK013]
MKLFGFTFFEKTVAEQESSKRSAGTIPQSLLTNTDGMTTGWTPIRRKTFNGEKNPGELGSPSYIIPDYTALRARAYEAKINSDVVKIITNKFFSWVVGTGLKLQSEPNETVLGLEKIKFDANKFSTNVEAYFSIFTSSKESSYTGMNSLDQLAAMAYECAYMGGDSLVVLRLGDKNTVKVQVIDGQHIVSPTLHKGYFDAAKEKGNTILHGIELDDKGEHVAYYVLVTSADKVFGEIERIPARGEESGLLMAWMIYSGKHRIDHQRGVSQLASILEKVAKLDRYTEATVSSAEERAKVVWTVEHSRFSEGENPLVAQIKRNSGTTVDDDPYQLGDVVAKNISATENKMVHNLPIGSKFSAPDSQSEIQYEPFWKAVFYQLCASQDIPPEVALQMYNSNYSASRAAINGWGFIINIYREKFAESFYKPIFNFWLTTHIYSNKVDAPGFIRALNEKNYYVVESFCAARFTGPIMPHIDPKKEAEAIRVMLGDDSTPLMTLEQATEQLGNGSFVQNQKKITEEKKAITPIADPVEPEPSKKVDNAVNS